ncbi:glycoside hydrolase family 2 TIM barrel-domain containing protein [Maribacter flavus]|uniref:DUF4982 domain-containing protein n=1 Tax=Maribacter flavus TaxID=1658664 RepID=A0A5B2TQE8_9FLAO|nr:glycoside hydrolase family 2 TIM barrel-domain containing protein [Maribacter flavus]KAA2215770.1 DUF4982 domain-containing protein [Maribacter flavus]
MRIYKFLGLLSLMVFMISCGEKKEFDSNGRNLLFNDGWRFLRDSVPLGEQVDFDDSLWMAIDLPHDFSIMDLPGGDTENQIGPFSRNAVGGGNGNAHTIGGTGWYRKSFTVDESDRTKTFIIKFDGVYMESEVWVNGKQVGKHVNGYTPFWYDITAFLNPVGAPNIIAVKTDNPGENTRWYSGSGIYRNVHLIVTEPVHVAVWGTRITTPEITTDKASVKVETAIENEMENDSEVEVTVVIKNSDGSVANSVTQTISISANSAKTVMDTIEIQNPSLWDLETPYLYTAEVTLEVDGEISDVYTQTFGIRSIEFTAEKGFLLNGKPVLLKGGNMHHDNGYLGAAAIEAAERRKVELMKSNGYNAIRLAHNPFSESFLNACDELGMLVINEFTDMWEDYKNKQDYHLHFTEHWEQDMTDFIMRDRNHPSVIMWSIGNEIPKKNVEDGVRIAKELVAKVNELDNSRPTTEAIPNFLIHGGWKNSKEYFDVIDIAGYNYMEPAYTSDHELYPKRIIYASESFPKDAYDYWKAVENHPYVIGDFVWTAMDYFGEVELANATYKRPDEIDKRSFQSMDGIPEGTNPNLVYDMMAMMSPSKWPAYISWCGDLDIMGDKKPQGQYRDVLWDRSPLEVLVHEPIPDGMVEDLSPWGWPNEISSWNWKGYETKALQVRVFTKAEKVRLELNGKIIAEKTISEGDEYIAEFKVPYEPGELRVIALNNGNEVTSKILTTTSSATSIRLTSERKSVKAGSQDLAFVKIEVVDNQNQRILQEDFEITIQIDGVGELIGSGNGNPRDLASVNNTTLRTFHGKAQAIIRPGKSKGEITMKVSSKDLKSAVEKILVE